VTVTLAQLGEYRRAKQLVELAEARLEADWLGSRYPAYLYGGWNHPIKGRIERAHEGAIRFHEACKALFCPECWAPVGYAPDTEDAVMTCPKHGEYPWRKCRQYRTVLLEPGNRWGKDFHGLAEFASWAMGVRPWDGSLTAPPGERPKLWVACCEDMSSVAQEIICPYLETRLGALIDAKIPGSAGRRTTAGYYLTNGDKIVIKSYRQFINSAGDTNPFEGLTIDGLYQSEPMPQGMREAALRGLISSQGEGWGRELIAATPLKSVYLYHAVHSKAWNLGGDRRDVFAIQGTIYDNPSLSEPEIEAYLSDLPPEEREARRNGDYLHVFGRVLPEFEALHIYDPEEFDPLVGEDGRPTSHPVFMAVDPHHRRPWFMLWVCMCPDGTLYAVDEWPKDEFHKMRSAAGLGYDDYIRVIAAVEEGLPGGARRVLARDLDPNFGRTPLTATQGRSVEEELNRRVRESGGVRFNTNTNDKIDTGLSALRTLLTYDRDRPVDGLNRPSLYVSRKCRNLIWALKNNVWEEFKQQTAGLKTVQSDTGKDPIDTLRYIVASKHRYRSWSEADRASAMVHERAEERLARPSAGRQRRGWS